MKKFFISILICILHFNLSYTFAQTPIINSFSPKNGRVGTDVEILGENFNSSASSNVVFFGATQAQVKSAAVGKLIVSIPSGANNKPITVLNKSNGLLAQTKTSFMVTSPFKGSITADDFSSGQNFTTGNTPQNLGIGDFDGDGRPDVAVTNSEQGTINILRNTSNRNENIALETQQSLNLVATNVIVADLNGDGKLDLVATKQYDINIFVFINRSTPGNIRFDSSLSFRAAGECTHIDVVDFDEDGKPDIVATTVAYYDKTISVLKNTSVNGVLSFDSFLDFDGTNNGYYLSCKDFDGDGKIDISVSNGGSVIFLRNTSAIGKITFAAKVSFKAEGSYDAGDLDGDGKPDFISVTKDPAVVSIFKNNSSLGNFSFSLAKSFPTSRYPSDVLIQDVDGDGKNDFFTYNGISSPIIYRNISAVNIDFDQTSTIVMDGLDIAVADMNADGIADVLTSKWSSGVICAYLNVSQRVVNASIPKISSFSPLAASKDALVQIKGSGFSALAANNDVFFGSTKAVVSLAEVDALTVKVPQGSAYEQITILNRESLNSGRSAFPFTYSPLSSKKAIYSSDFDPEFKISGPQYFNNAKFADVDNDGKPDLIVSNSNSNGNGISIYRNVASPGTLNASSLVSKIDLGINGKVYFVSTGDVNGDGKIDLLVAIDNRLLIFINTTTNGNISFVNKINLENNSSAEEILVNDVDGDGKADLLVVGSGYQAMVYKNTSIMGQIESISFASPVTIYSKTRIHDLKLGDIDGDGKIDLAFLEEYVGNTPSGFVILLNKSVPGNISFDAPVKNTVYNTSLCFNLIDIDGDDRLDAVVGCGPGLGFLLFAQNTSTPGNVSFGTLMIRSLESSVSKIDVADIDGDGRPDLAFADNSRNLVGILRNTSVNGKFDKDVFGPLAKIPVNAESPKIVLTDIDGDGRVDILTTGYTSLCFLRNNPNPLQAPPTITSFSPVNAKTGAVVSITGKFLSNATNVSFGDKAALNFKVVSDNLIEATVANGASGIIRVETPDGAIEIDGFKYDGPPVLNSFSPSSASGGETVTILGSNLTGTALVRFGGVPVKSFNVVSDQKIEAVVADNANSGSIIITTPNGTGAIGGYMLPLPVISIDTKRTFLAGTKITPVTIESKGGAIPDGLYSEVSTFAGSGNEGLINGSGLAAFFNLPSATATDKNGNVYVTDSKNNVIRKITPQGTTTTYAGSGKVGATNGAGLLASFNSPTGIAVDLNDNIYVSEYNNNLIRKISPDGEVSTLAGGGANSADGLGKAAGFNNPAGMITDFKGNIFVCDVSNHRIRKITPEGLVTTIAGGSVGSADGAGSSASFNRPYAISTDGTGNFFVVEQSGNLLRKVTESGVVSTVAGNGNSYGTLDGQGKDARFNQPIGVAVDGGGSIFVSENYNFIRKVTPSGYVNTLAGNGKQGNQNGIGTLAVFKLPNQISVNALGDIYVADMYNHQIKKIRTVGYQVTPALPQGLELNADGTISGTPAEESTLKEYTITAYNVSGSGSAKITMEVLTPGPPTITSFSPLTAKQGETIKITGSHFTGTTQLSLGGISVASFVVDSDQQITAVVGIGKSGDVKLITPGGEVSKNGFTFSGPYIESFLPQAAALGQAVTITGTGFSGAKSVSFGGNNAASYNIESDTKIVAILGNGFSGDVSVMSNIGTASKPGFLKLKASPVTVSYENKHVFNVNRSIKAISPTVQGGTVPEEIYTNLTTYAGTFEYGETDGPISQASFFYPSYMTIDQADNIYLIAGQASAIRKISADGIVSTLVPTAALSFLGSSSVNAIAIDASGNLYVSVGNGQMIKKISPSGMVSHFAGSGKVGSNDGNANDASFNNIMGLVVDAQGNVYAGDFGNNMIRKISPGGIVTTLTGSTFGGTKDGALSEALFLGPSNLIIDPLGNIIVSDTKNNLIRKISPAGKVTTLAGNGTAGYADGLGKAAAFNRPYGLSTDNLANVYVADQLNYRIRKITPAGLVSTLVGLGTYTSKNGVGTAAGALTPTGIVTNQQGSVIFSEFNGSMLKRISLSGYTISPALPSGLVLDSKTGIISGTPTKESAATDYTITANNQGGTGSSVVNIAVTAFNLPMDNFVIKGTSSTCPGANNGSIEITAKEKLPYRVAITGYSPLSGQFNDRIVFNDLRRFIFTVCITVDGQPDFKRCFTIAINEPAPLTVYSAVNSENNIMKLQLSGGENYKITLNDKEYTTSESTYSLKLADGINTVQVQTDKLCQGVYADKIQINNKVMAYPNPFGDELNIQLQNAETGRADVEVIDASGKKVYNKQHDINSGTTVLQLSHLVPGVYVVKVRMTAKTTIFKVWKK